MTTLRDLCGMCESIGNGKCNDDRTECECNKGFTGRRCSVSNDTTHVIKYNTTFPSILNMTPLNISSIIAVILGCILFLILLGLFIFIFWKRRKSQKKKSPIPTSPVLVTKHIITPPLYNVSISRENSLPLSDPPIPEHIYEDLP